METHTKSLKTLLAKDGVIYKEAMAIVAEDVKKIMAEEVWQYTHDYNHVMEMHKLANEERIFQKEMEKEPPPAS